jgi:hypothetical protein
VLELAQRFPSGSDPETAWREGVTAFQARATAYSRQPSTPTPPR